MAQGAYHPQPVSPAMNIGAIARRKVQTLNFTEPVARALYLMQEEGVRHLPILRNRAPAGMVSDHNILNHIGWQDEAHWNAAVNDRVEKIMRHPIVTVSPNEPISEVAKLIVQRNIGAIPLVDKEGQLVGIATKSDFLKCFLSDAAIVSEENKACPVADHMSTEILSVHPDDPTLDALQLMKSKRIQHLLVVEDQEVIGILSDRDILRGAPKSGADSKTTHGSPLHVRGLMSEEVLALGPEAQLRNVARAMTSQRIGAIPIVQNDGKLVGIVTESDLLKVIAGPIEDRMFQF